MSKKNATPMQVEIHEKLHEAAKETKAEGSSGGLCIVELTADGYTPAWSEIEKAFFEGRNIMYHPGGNRWEFAEDFRIEGSSRDQIQFGYGLTIFADGSYYDE